jgi:hypothetical protein
VRELENLGIGLEKGAARIERQVARQLRHATHRMRHMEGKIDLGRWAGGRDYYIKVPHNCDLTLRTSTGDLSVTNVNGTSFIQTSSGDSVLTRLSGNLLVSSASGEIHAEGIDGKVGVRSASGDLVFRRARLQEISISTASGDIELDLLSVPERAFEVKTVSGDVRVELPPDARLSVEVTTFSGDIHCDLPHERTRRRPGRTTDLNINGGGTQAHFSSVSGDVSIERGSSFVDAPSVREGGEPTMDLSRAQAASEDLRQAQEDAQQAEADRKQAEAGRRQSELEILQAVERGELSPQDAMARLSDLGQ